MPLVAGVDSSTQSCKIVLRDAATGTLVREGRAAHPHGTEVDPSAWWTALQEAAVRAGGLDDVAAIAVGGQQHGMVCLGADGEVVRPALLWNDTRSARAATDLVAELGGSHAWVDAVGLVPVASFTVTKLRWMAEHEPVNAERTEAVALPHDWLSWHLGGRGGLGALRTDRGDASGTGYWSPASGAYRHDIVVTALGKDVLLPAVLGPAEPAARTATGAIVGPGTGDNMAAALGLGAEPGTVIVSIGTSGVASSVTTAAVSDPDGVVAGFADATGRFLPLVATLNAARVLDATARTLGVDHDELSRLALSAPPGAEGLVLVPYLEGERTPNRPDATGSLLGMRLANTTPAHLARAAVEGLLCGLRGGIEALERVGVRVDRVIIIGGGSRLDAVRVIAPTIFGCPVSVPPADEYVANGAARQAAWVLSGEPAPPSWSLGDSLSYEAEPMPWILDRYREAQPLGLNRPS